MSILLDALKKSEAQRQLGETPTIHTPTDAPQASSVEVKPWLAGLMLLSVAALLALYVTEQFDEPDLSILGYSELDLSSKPQPRAEPDVGQKVSQRSDDTARTPVESFSQEPDAARSDQAAQSSKARLRQSVSDYKPPASTGPGIAQESPSGLPADTGRAQPAAEPEPPPALTYWQLPQAVRDNLGELKISVLVYASNPEDRFILMGGQRLKEGDDGGGGLHLDEIRRDGALFTYRKYTFILAN